MKRLLMMEKIGFNEFIWEEEVCWGLAIVRIIFVEGLKGSRERVVFRLIGVMVVGRGI